MKKELNSAVIYEVFVRNHSTEGTLEKVREDLKRIKNIGADILWLMPIHPIGKIGRKGTYGSPYAIQDYTKISPEIGNKDDFKSLINDVHKLDMKIIIDAVLNHTSRDSLLLSRHPNYFYKDETGKVGRKCEDWSDVYDLDYNNKDLWDYLIEVLGEWVDLGIDGFRCDVASLIPIEFWVEAKKRLGAKKDLIWLAESVDPSFIKEYRYKGYVAHSDVELHRVFDITYDYDGYDYLSQYLKGDASLDDYIKYLYIQEVLYPANALKLRFLENHDIPRCASIFTDEHILKNWVVFYTLLRGVTLVYSGQEIRAKHCPNLFEKDSIDWNSSNKEFSLFFNKVINITKQIKQLCNEFNIKKICNGVYKIKQKSKTKTYKAIVNLENKFGKRNSDIKLNGKELISENQIKIENELDLNKLPIIVEEKDNQ